MEVTIGDYGRMMFEMMTGKYKDMPEHWRSIYGKAEPMIRQLVELNNEMKGGGYRIVGYIKDGKKVLSGWEAVRLAQKRLWGAKIGDLKIGDLVWLLEDHDMCIGSNDPCPIEYIHKNYVAVEVPHMGGEHIEKIHPTEIVLKAPDDWKEKEMLYTSDSYWVDKANELGI